MSIRTLLRSLFQDPFRGASRKCVPSQPPYHGQCAQDRIFHRELFGDRRSGVFVDVGANDGVDISNTLFFERDLGWRGLCIEPIPEVFARLETNRSAAACIQACVASEAGTRTFLRVSGYAEMLSGLLDAYDPRHLERIREEVAHYGGSMEEIEVRAVPLHELFREHGIDSIDLMCVDVEGGEMEVLSFFNDSSVRPRVICIENNYRDPRVWRTLRSQGYRPHARVEQDEIYLARGFVPAPLRE